MDRRSFIKTGLITGISTIAVDSAKAKLDSENKPTPSEIEGPFYPLTAQKDVDFDLTQFSGRDGVATGRIITIEGRVLDTKGRPISDAVVDLWQANANGRYRHPSDSSNAPLDPNFQGWAIVPSGKDGSFKFKTIFPGSYKVSRNWTRPPHIHFKVSKVGFLELITQMYFLGHKLNDVDYLLNEKSPVERKQMIAVNSRENPNSFSYTIVLQRQP